MNGKMAKAIRKKERRHANSHSKLLWSNDQKQLLLSPTSLKLLVKRTKYRIKRMPRPKRVGFRTGRLMTYQFVDAK